MWYWSRYSVQKDIQHDLDQKHMLLLGQICGTRMFLSSRKIWSSCSRSGELLICSFAWTNNFWCKPSHCKYTLAWTWLSVNAISDNSEPAKLARCDRASQLIATEWHTRQQKISGKIAQKSNKNKIALTKKQSNSNCREGGNINRHAFTALIK